MFIGFQYSYCNDGLFSDTHILDQSASNSSMVVNMKLERI
jgi:hypothetical protein